MNIELLFGLFSIFGITTIYALVRTHWSEFSVFLCLTFFAGMGFLFGLMS